LGSNMGLFPLTNATPSLSQADALSAVCVGVQLLNLESDTNPLHAPLHLNVNQFDQIAATVHVMRFRHPTGDVWKFKSRQNAGVLQGDKLRPGLMAKRGLMRCRCTPMRVASVASRAHHPSISTTPRKDPLLVRAKQARATIPARWVSNLDLC
jgi:hypothetical protein